MAQCEPRGVRFTAAGGQTSFRLEGVDLPALPTCQTCLCIKHSAALHHASPHLLLLHSPRFFPKEKMSTSQAENTQSDGKSFEQLRHECLMKGVLFEDPDFPAKDSSLFFSEKVPVHIEWKRPTVCEHWAFLYSKELLKSVRCTCAVHEFQNTEWLQYVSSNDYLVIFSYP